jgi:hypothetical protein
VQEERRDSLEEELGDRHRQVFEETTDLYMCVWDMAGMTFFGDIHDH